MEINNNKLQCKICDEWFNYKSGFFTKHLKTEHNISIEEYYNQYLKENKNEGKCNTCGNTTKFRSIFRGYAKYCCRTCADKDPQKHINATNTMIERYGDNYKQEIYVNRPKQTKLERYGDENYNNSEKNKETCLDRYGVDNIRKSEEYKEYCKEVKLEIYGDENYNNRKQANKTNLERYGGTGFASEELRNKGRITNKEKYGFEIAMHNPEIAQKVSIKQKENAVERMQKTRETNLEKYGYENIGQVPEIQEQRKQTCLEKYGVEYAFQSEEIKNRIKETNQEKYNVDWAIASPEIQQKSFETRKKNGNQSKDEIYFKEICDQLDIIYVEQYQDKKYPFQCDFYLPEKDLFVEVNTHWTHGGHWFNENNEIDKKQLQNWKGKDTKYYDIAIQTWTKRDVQKRVTAKENNLNYIVLWDIMDINLWFSLDCPIGKDWESEYSWLPNRKLINNLSWKLLGHGKQRVIDITKKAQFYEFYKRELKMWNFTDIWNPDRLQINLYNNRLQYINKTPYELSDLEILRGLSISGKIRAYSHFNNTGMKKFIEKYNIYSIFDPCAGWGERLVTCAALNINYFGIDINEKAIEGHQRIIKHYNLINQKTICRDSNNYINNEHFDTTFTCPPYWKEEIYTEQGAENLSYNDFLSWWKQTVKNSNTEIFAYQINCKYKEDMNQVLLDLGYTFIEEIELPNKSSHFTRGKNGINRKKEYESIQIFKKV